MWGAVIQWTMNLTDPTGTTYPNSNPKYVQYVARGPIYSIIDNLFIGSHAQLIV